MAWGMTHGYGDYRDLFIEKFRTYNDQVEYVCQETWRQAVISDEVLRVRGGTDETLRVVATHYGPIIAGDPAHIE
jgi:penicillin amidase